MGFGLWVASWGLCVGGFGVGGAPRAIGSKSIRTAFPASAVANRMGHKPTALRRGSPVHPGVTGCTPFCCVYP